MGQGLGGLDPSGRLALAPARPFRVSGECLRVGLGIQASVSSSLTVLR